MFSLLRSVQREGGQTLNKGPAPIGAAIIEKSLSIFSPYHVFARKINILFILIYKSTVSCALTEKMPLYKLVFNSNECSRGHIDFKI